MGCGVSKAEDEPLEDEVDEVENEKDDEPEGMTGAPSSVEPGKPSPKIAGNLPSEESHLPSSTRRSNAATKPISSSQNVATSVPVMESVNNKNPARRPSQRQPQPAPAQWEEEQRQQKQAATNPTIPPEVEEVVGASFPWAEIEYRATLARLNRCQHTLQQVFGGEGAEQPRMALAMSGSGFRAMMGSIALLDALSTPLDASRVCSGTEGLRLLDCILHVAAGSGAALVPLIALCGSKESNPFHSDPLSSKQPPLNPWVYESKGFDELIHHYKGLLTMTSSALIQMSSMYDEFSRNLGLASNFLTVDMTLPSILAQERLGATMMERWSSFLAGALLHFKSSKQSIERMLFEGLAAKHILDSSFHTRLGSEAVKRLVESGDYPMMLAGCVARRNSPSHGSPKSKQHYSWVEVCPFFVRNLETNEMADDVDNLNISFPLKPNLGPSQQREGRSDRNVLKARMHHWLAIATSSHAMDVVTSLPKPLHRALLKQLRVHQLPPQGSGIAQVYADNGSFSAELQDCAVDMELPLPLLLQGSGREYDIILAVDNGFESNAPVDLMKAIQRGYYKLHPTAKSPVEPLAPGQRVRIYRGADGFPSIIYFKGFTEWGTLRFIEDVAPLRRALISLRDAVESQLVPAIQMEVQRVQARLRGDPPPPLVHMKPYRSKCRQYAILENDTPYQGPFQRALHRQMSGEFGTSQLTQQVFAECVKHNRVVDLFSAYRGIERIVLACLPKPPDGPDFLCFLERYALSNLNILNVVENRTLDEAFCDRSPLFLWILRRIGIAEREADGTHKMPFPWQGYYASLGLCKTLFAEDRHLIKKVTRGATLQTIDVVKPAMGQMAYTTVRKSRVWLFVAHLAMNASNAKTFKIFTDFMEQAYQEQRPSNAHPRYIDLQEEFRCFTAFGLTDIYTLLVGQTRSKFQEEARAAYQSLLRMVNKYDGTVGLCRMAEGAARHPSIQPSLELLSMILGHLDRVTPEYREDYCRVIGVAMEEGEALLNTAPKKDALRDFLLQRNMTISFHESLIYSLVGPMTRFIVMERPSLTFAEMAEIVVTSRSRHATYFGHRARKECIVELWRRSIHLGKPLEDIAEVCMREGYYYMFFCSVVRVIPVPTPLSHWREEALLELCRQSPLLQYIVLESENTPVALIQNLRDIADIHGQTTLVYRSEWRGLDNQAAQNPPPDPWNSARRRTGEDVGNNTQPSSYMARKGSTAPQKATEGYAEDEAAQRGRVLHETYDPNADANNPDAPYYENTAYFQREDGYFDEGQYEGNEPWDEEGYQEYQEDDD